MAPRWKMVSFIADSPEAMTPAANLDAVRRALREGMATAELVAAFERTEGTLARIAAGLKITHPAGVFGVFAVRWWRLDGSKGLLRTPVLVRMRRVGRYCRPVRVKSRAVQSRRDGAFALNADLVARLIAAYWLEYGAWLELKSAWTSYRWWRRRLQRVEALVDTVGERYPIEAILRTARGRVEATGRAVQPWP